MKAENVYGEMGKMGLFPQKRLKNLDVQVQDFASIGCSTDRILALGFGNGRGKKKKEYIGKQKSPSLAKKPANAETGIGELLRITKSKRKVANE